MKIFKNRAAVGIISIIIGLIICFGLTPLFAGAVKAKTTVVRVTKTIKEGEKITASKVSTIEVGKYGLPDNVLADTSLVVGKYAVVELHEGDYIMDSKIDIDPVATHKYLLNLDGKQHAISFSVKSFASGLSNKLVKGDIISIIASDSNKQTHIPKSLKYVKVLAVTANSGNDTNAATKTENDKEEETEKVETVTVLVNEMQAKALVDLENNAKIHIALVYRGDESEANKFLKVQEDAIK